MTIERGSLRPASDAPATGELVEAVAAGGGWRIEQILSGPLLAPVEDLLDHEEWAVVLSGAAVVEIDGSRVALAAGDWLRIPPGLPHRVVSTEPPTSWLAVHLPSPVEGPAR